MFEKSAYIYDAYHSFLDYSAASEKLQALIQRYNPKAETLLDVACGTGKHLEALRGRYCVEGLDLSADLLEIASKRCPGVILHLGNMVDFDLGRRFDVVTCLFASIAYVKTIENAERAVACMARHLQPGGILVVEPWVSPENCWTNRVTADFTDEPGLKIARMYTHEIEGHVSVYDINYLVGTPQGIMYFRESEELGLFTHEEYIGSFRKAKLEMSYDKEYELFPKHKYGIYIGVKQ